MSAAANEMNADYILKSNDDNTRTVQIQWTFKVLMAVYGTLLNAGVHVIYACHPWIWLCQME